MLKQVFIAILAAIFLYLILSLVLFVNIIRPTKISSEVTPKDLDLEYEQVEFESSDGIKLSGWFIPSQQKTRNTNTIVVLHGYPASKGDVLPSLTSLQKNFNLFLFDFRYFGDSAGNYTTAGAREVKDLQGALIYLKSRGIEEVGLWGFSMGGAVALRGAAKQAKGEFSNRTARISAVVSQASYSNLGQLSQEVYPLSMGTTQNLWAQAILGINPYQISPAKSAKAIDVPVAISHFKSDQVIPFSHSMEIKSALPDNLKAEFWFTKQGAHGFITEKRVEKIKAFFLNYLE